MTWEMLCYVLIAWMQVMGFCDCFSERASDRFFGQLQLVIATALLFTAEWWVK
ncbi:hypothetical protein KLEP174_gp78 [Pseudomonas phage vB_PcuM_ KLEP17-4]|nr:hypothetical protein KLEP174_gp78 [Pseudomonas phage vB_PcuM_ KLEP17-4]